MNMLIVGPPKAGNHAFQRALLLMGAEVPYYHLHYHDRNRIMRHMGIDRACFLTRDPRNMVISRMRAKGKVLTEDSIHRELVDWDNGRTLADMLGYFEGWLVDPCPKLRFEDLIDGERGMRLAAETASTAYLPGKAKDLPSHDSITWSGRLSNWQDHWTPAVERAWEGSCPGLLERWGYEGDPK